METTSDAKPTFPFMDLPLEVRMEIYDCYAGIVSVDEDNEEERKAITNTRKALLSVSRQVNAEWSAVFFRTTSIIVHGPISAYIADWGRFIRTERQLTFDKVFIKSVRTSTINNIRTICYDATLHGPFAYLHGGKPSSVSFQNLRRLAHTLKRSASNLSSLQHVEVYARWTPWMRKNWVPSPQPSDKEMWALVGEGGKWEEIEDMFVSRGSRTALTNWDISRNIEVIEEDKTQRRVFWGSTIFSVHVHFSKKGSGTADDTSEAHRQLTVRVRPREELVKAFIDKYKN